MPIRLMIAAIFSLFLARASFDLFGADDQSAAARASLERIQALRKDRPGDGLLVFYESLTRLRLGEREAAFDLLRSLKGRKLGLIPVRDNAFDGVWNDPQFQAIRNELADDEEKIAEAPVAFRLSDPKLIPEGIAYDPAGDRFFIGSIAQRKIVVANRKREARDFSQSGDKLDCVLGLAVDAARGHLYAVSTNGFLDEAKTQRRNQIVRYDLKSGEVTGRYSAPDALQLNDLAIAADGTIYATDSMGGSLFRKQPNETTLVPLGAAGRLAGANGIAFGTEGRLYIAIATGIARIDLPSGEPTRLPQSDSVVTGGIDGLYFFEGDLIGIQNVTNPGRVIRISLADHGNRIAGLRVLQSHQHPEFREPTTGAIANGRLHVIANSNVGYFQPDGTIKDVDQLKATAIVAVPLKPAALK